MTVVPPHPLRPSPVFAGGPTPPLRFAVHGLAVEVRCDDPALSAVADAVRRQFEPFASAEFPPGFGAVTGTVEPFDAAVVQRHLSTAAVRFPVAAGHTAEIFHDPADAERFWLVDDRWGIAELNLLRAGGGRGCCPGRPSTPSPSPRRPSPGRWPS